jgi:hypothetical protein
MMPRDLLRPSALLLFGVFVASGCGSSVSQQLPARRAAARSPGSPAATAVARFAGRSPETSRDGSRLSGITGQAVASDCAVPRAGKRTCPRHRVRATVEVLRVPSGDQIAMVRTDRAGHFRLSVPSGAYRLVSQTSGSLLFARPVAVRVRPHHFARVWVSFFPRHPLSVAPGPNECKACPPPPP